MKKRTITPPIHSIILTAIIFILLFSAIKYFFFTYQNFAEILPIREGSTTINSENFSKNQHMRLDGEWHFYPNSLVPPDKLNDYPKETITVPGNWKENINKDDNSAIGYGTYHVQIHFPQKTEDVYSIYLVDLYTTSKVYINGELVGENGTMPDKTKESKPKIKPLRINITPDSEIIDLVIHVVNDEFPNQGGILKSVRFGNFETINTFDQRFRLLDYFTIITYSIYLIYALFMFFLGQRNKELLYYTLFIGSSIIFFLFDRYLLITSFLSIPSEAIFKVKILSLIGISLFSLLFFKTLYSDNFKRKTVQYITIFHILLCCVTLLIPFSLIFYPLTLSYILMIMIFLYIAWTSIISRFYNERYYKIIIFIHVSMLSGAIWNGIFTLSNVTLAYYPIEIIFAIIGFTILLFKRSIIQTEKSINLSKKMKEVNDLNKLFTASTTHEIRNPLQMIMNITHNVLTDSSLDEEDKKQLSLIISLGKQMNISIDDLKDISKIHDGTFDLQRAPISLSHLVTGVYNVFIHYINEDRVNILIDIPDDFPSLYVDEARLSQVLFNLFHNAIKFTNEGSIKITAKIENDEAVISVEDTGIGIENNLIDNIFKPFVLDVDSAARAGTGIGLAVTKHIIHKHGGEIYVNSKVDIGTTFSFTIPLHTEEIPSDVDSIVREELDDVKHLTNYLQKTLSLQRNDYLHEVITGASILIVDDDQLNLKMIANILKKNYNIYTVTNGKDALKRIKEIEFDLVITDLMMPNMSGYQLTRKIREQYSLSELPIILLTARGLLHDKYHGFLAGANEFVVKPVDALELQARVHVMTTLKYSIRERLNYEAAWQQAQIKPHFLFNTLGSIMALSYSDTDKMMELLKEFTNYLRKSFQVTNTDEIIPLEDELDLVHSYLYIEKVRFGNRLNIIYDVDNLKDLYVPPLSVQTIVENGLKHGILSKVDGGTIEISVKRLDDHAILNVYDNGRGFKQEEIDNLLRKDFNTSGGIGLVNTNARMKRLFGTSLKVTSEIDKGTSVTFFIPYKLS